MFPSLKGNGVSGSPVTTMVLGAFQSEGENVTELWTDPSVRSLLERTI